LAVDRVSHANHHYHRALVALVVAVPLAEGSYHCYGLAQIEKF
jgi:hypothetical protein